MKVFILCGGSGTRLWPLSRKNHPKQFLRIGSDKSFLQKTVERNLLLVDEKKLFIVTHQNYVHDIKKHIPYSLTNNIILEPMQKNTAPAIFYALSQISLDEDPIFVCPADQHIFPEDQYIQAVKEADCLAKEGFFVTFGVPPVKPETGYGYIKAVNGKVITFVEKPDSDTAKHYVESGDYFWNAGMFMFLAKTFKEEISQHFPDWIDASFEQLPNISIDYAIAEKSKRGAMVKLSIEWSDIGSFENVYEFLKKDENENVLQGDVLTLDTEKSLVLAEKRHVSTIGLKNVLVIETADAVLVADKSRSQEIKNIVGTLRDLGKKMVDDHLTVHRPWGSYTVMMEMPRYKIKKIIVKPLQKLSLQLHYHRSEHWIIVSGTANVLIGEEETLIHEGQSIYVPKSAVHRVENPGKVPLEIIEVQVGEYLEEDDIVRLEDIYERKSN